MYIKLIGLYHSDPEDSKYSSYWRRQGYNCFDFTPRKELATDLTESESADILKHKDHYCETYGAADMVTEL